MPTGNKTDRVDKFLIGVAKYKFAMVGLVVIGVAIFALQWAVTSTDIFKDPKVKEWEAFIIDRWFFEDREGLKSIMEFHDIGRFDYYLEISNQSGTFGQWEIIETDGDTALVHIVSDKQDGVEMTMQLIRLDQNTMDTRATDVEGDDYTRFSRTKSDS
jgi:hypothetical protein